MEYYCFHVEVACFADKVDIVMTKAVIIYG
jgi:hypothetical protein